MNNCCAEIPGWLQASERLLPLKLPSRCEIKARIEPSSSGLALLVDLVAGRPQNAVDRADDLVPVGWLGHPVDGRPRSAGRTSPTVVLGGAPERRHPPPVLEPMQHGIERSVLDLEFAERGEMPGRKRLASAIRFAVFGGESLGPARVHRRTVSSACPETAGGRRCYAVWFGRLFL
jgi:hypothetical protein